jgi:glutamate-5-semialdehyde dehydrogenase
MTDAEIQKMVIQKSREAKEASWEMARAKKDAKNMALMSMADSLKNHEAEILGANAKDVEAAKAAGLSKAMLDRLTLDAKRLADTGQGLREVAKLPDPVGGVIDTRTRPNGLRIDRVRAPLGVVGIVYESRPNVTVDAASLCLKAGNAVILRGGSEALLSNLALAKSIQEGLLEASLPPAAVQIMELKDREVVLEMLHRRDEIDVIIPRGGKELIDFVVKESHIPVIRHDIGNCHVYVDHDADFKMAEDIALRQGAEAGGLQLHGAPAGPPARGGKIRASRRQEASGRGGGNSR